MKILDLSSIPSFDTGDHEKNWSHFSEQVSQKYQSDKEKIITVQQNIARAIYEMSAFLKNVSLDDFANTEIVTLYECPSFRDGMWNEIREIQDEAKDSIIQVRANGNTLPPNKKLIAQKQNPEYRECPQGYPTVEFLEYISKRRQENAAGNFVIMGTIMSSSIHGTPHVQIQPDYNGSIKTIEEIVTDDQKFNPQETSDILRAYNKQGKLCTLLALVDGNFAILEVDNFLGISPRPEIIVDESNGYAINTLETQEDTLYAQMARDFSGNQGLAIGGVELWTTNLVFEKETLYYRFYKRLQKGITEDQMTGFLMQLFSDYKFNDINQLIQNIIKKVYIFGENMKKIQTLTESEIRFFLQILQEESNIDTNIVLSNNKILQQQLLLAFLMTKGKIYFKDNTLTISKNKRENNITLFTPEHLITLYSKARKGLVSKKNTTISSGTLEQIS